MEHRVPSGTSTGPGGIPMMLLKIFGPKSKASLREVVNKSLTWRRPRRREFKSNEFNMQRKGRSGGHSQLPSHNGYFGGLENSNTDFIGQIAEGGKDR